MSSHKKKRTEKKSSAKGGAAKGGFTDDNAKWLQPKKAS